MFLFQQKISNWETRPENGGTMPLATLPFSTEFCLFQKHSLVSYHQLEKQNSTFLNRGTFFFLTRPFSGLGEENLGSICKSSELPNFLQNSCAFNSCAKGSTDSCNFFNHNIGRKKDMHTCQKVLFCLSFRYAEPYIQKPVFLQVIQHNPIHV